MKLLRHALPMLLFALLLALLPALAAAQDDHAGHNHGPKIMTRSASTPKPSATPPPPPGIEKHPRFRGFINGVPDTGQFIPDSTVVLRVGPRRLTAIQFVTEYYTSYPEYRPGVDSTGLATFLTTLMHRDVLGLTALALNRPLAFEDRIALRETRQRALSDRVLQRFVRDSVTVTEEDTRALWEGFRHIRRFRHVLVNDRATAERVRRDLLSGRLPFAAAVAKYSIARGESPDGDLGWQTAEKLDPAMIAGMFTLKVGEYAPPLRDSRGWHVVQCTDRKPMTPPDYGAFRTNLNAILTNVRTSVHMDRLNSILRARIGLALDTTAAQRVAEFYLAATPASIPNTLQLDVPTPEFSNEDTARTLASWNQGRNRLSIGMLMRYINDIPPIMRPRLDNTEAALRFAQGLALDPYMAEYGAEMGLDEDPVVKQRLDRKLEELMVEHMYQDSVGTRIYVTKPERLAHYEKNKAQYYTYPRVTFAAIVRESKAGADSVANFLARGGDARVLLHADSLAGRTSGSIRERRQDEGGPYHKALFEEMRPGDVQVRGPDKQGDYAILKLLDFDPGRQLAYDEVVSLIDESLQNIKAQAAIDAMLARLQQRYTVTMRFDLMPLIRLVDPFE